MQTLGGFESLVSFTITDSSLFFIVPTQYIVFLVVLATGASLFSHHHIKIIFHLSLFEMSKRWKSGEAKF